MRISFSGDFNKSLKKINNQKLAKSVEEIIKNVEEAKSPLKIKSIKKLKGHRTAFRIKSGTYRIGIFIEKNEVNFAAIAHRKDIYGEFP